MKTRLTKMITAAALAIGMSLSLAATPAQAGDGYYGGSHHVYGNTGLDPVVRDILRATVRHITHRSYDGSYRAPHRPHVQKKHIKKKVYKKGYRDGYKEAKREFSHKRKHVWRNGHAHYDAPKWKKQAWKNHKRKVKAHRVAAYDRPGQICYPVTKHSYTKNGRPALFGATACEGPFGNTKIVTGTRHIITRY